MSAFAPLHDYLNEKPHPLIGAETVQLLLLREILDYTVLRTEETRDLNTVQTPLSVENPEAVRRVAFLASKQKAAESRELEHLLRSAALSVKYSVPDGPAGPGSGCYLKDNLCMSCPRCGLFGATSTAAGGGARANIKHRIEYSTAFSLVPFDEIAQSHTFNAINDANQTVGQALGSRESVGPATLFPSVVTLKSVTERELVLAVKVLLSCKSYGAESRIGGDVRNHIVGVVAGWEEVITALEFSLELYARQEALTSEAVVELVREQYVPLAGNPHRVRMLDAEEAQALVQACRAAELDKPFVEAAYSDIQNYRRAQGV